MTSPLFRPEAIAHQQEVKMGVALAVKTHSWVWMTITFIVLVLAVLAFLGSGEYTRKARVTGFLSPDHGLVKVFTPQEGTVMEKHVKEGQHVQAGDVLLVLSSERASLENAEVQSVVIANIVARRDSLLLELEQQDEQQRMHWIELQDRVAAIEQELRALDRLVDVQQRRMDSSRQMLEKFRRLHAQQYVAEIHWQQKQDEMLERQSELEALQRERLRLQREHETQQNQLQASRYEFARQRSELDRMISDHELQIAEYQTRRSVVIRAPREGVVSAILLETGQLARTGTPLLSLLPSGAELQAHLLVPSRSIGFLVNEQHVALRYQAYPYQRFGSHAGRVKEISKTLIQPGEGDLPVALSEPAYRVVVGLDAQTITAYGKDLPLQAGMLVDADIQLDKRSLIHWVFDPVYSLAGTL